MEIRSVGHVNHPNHIKGSDTKIDKQSKQSAPVETEETSKTQHSHKSKRRHLAGLEHEHKILTPKHEKTDKPTDIKPAGDSSRK